MDVPAQFPDLIARIRAGDEAAARELVRCYEPEIRRAVRVRLTDPNLRRIVDSVDICQSVFGEFFVRVAAGQFELADPTRLVRLLVRMSRNKIIDYAKRPENRDTRTPGEGVLDGAMASGGTPSNFASVAELLASAKQRMSPEEWEVAEKRAAGVGWQEIAASLGTTAEAARKRHNRTVNRVCVEIGLSGEDA